MTTLRKIVVCGNVDAGKSTLIGRLLYETGTLAKGVLAQLKAECLKAGRDFEFAHLLDSFEEERTGALSIDTTQVFCKTRRGIPLLLIDVPGHQELLRNMLTGSSLATAALLVVDVRQPIEEQTNRHALLLKFLGIDEILVAVNKMDTVGFAQEAFAHAQKEIAAGLHRIGIRPRQYIPLSASAGLAFCHRAEEMPWHHGPWLLAALTLPLTLQPPRPLRLIVQDVYLHARQRIAVGQIIGGRMRKGQRLTVAPLKKTFRLKEIKVFGQRRQIAEAPQSVGVVLESMEMVERGHVIYAGAPPGVAAQFKAHLFCLRPVSCGTPLYLQCATQATNVTLTQIDGIWDSGSLRRRQEGAAAHTNDLLTATLRCARPIVVEPYAENQRLGRFILSGDDREICAVGTVSAL